MSLAGFKGPDWKPTAGARSRTRGRKRANAADWRKLHAAKGGACRACGTTDRYELHHLLSRARGGPDAFWNLVPLCTDCHGLVTREDAATLRKLAGSLMDDEYAGLIEHSGEQVFERLFGVTYEAAR